LPVLLPPPQRRSPSGIPPALSEHERFLLVRLPDAAAISHGRARALLFATRESPSRPLCPAGG
jgi:hypothetical protein